MIDFTVYHEAKSKFAYIFDKDTVHLRLFATKNKIKTIEVIYGDPFNYDRIDKENNKWEWVKESAETSFMDKEYEVENFDYFFLSIKPKYKRTKYAFLINNQYLYGSKEIVDLNIYPKQKYNLFNFFNFPFINEEDIFDAPSWVEDQVWYSIFPERFHNGDHTINPNNTLKWNDTDKYSNSQRFGGDLEGIIQKLPYLKSIGFTGIYMTPIFKSDSAHKYDVIDYYKIDGFFGDNDKFKELVENAHKLGLKVMLDAVFNHSSFRHPYFIDVIKNGKKSKYYDCFYVIDDTKPVVNFPINNDFTINKSVLKSIYHNHDLLNYRTFAFTPLMPKLNTDNSIMKEHLLGAAKYWIEEYDIDGWRLDVSNEIGHKFWRDFRITVKDSKKDTYIVGENWDNSNPWLQGDQYDGVMNYEILFPIWNYFGTNIQGIKYSSTQFMFRINKVLVDYPKNVLRSMYNLVDSHDTERILEICSNNIDLVKLPYIFLFAFPGAPSVYYGGEIGLGGKGDPDNRRCMIWDEKLQNKDILEHIKRLIKLRSTFKEFKSTEFKWIETNDELEYLIFQKGDLVFILNKSEKSQIINLPIELQNIHIKDIYNNIDIKLDEKLVVNGYGFYILKK